MKKKVDLSDIIKRYQKLYLPAITDVLDKWGYFNQWLGKNIKPLYPKMKVVGEAFTVKWVSDPNRENEDKTLDTKMLDSLSANKVVVVDCGKDDRSGHWGVLATITAKHKGVTGIVVAGAVRDTGHILEQGLPVFAEYTSPLEAFGRSKIIAIEIPIDIHGVTVNPGDIIFGDIDGVVCIPRKIAMEVLEKAEHLIINEAKIRQELIAGVSATEVRDKYGQF